MRNLGPSSFRPGFGRWLTGGFAVVCSIAAIASLASDGLRSIYLLWPWLALLVGTCWAFFWRPEVGVDEHGVTLVNVTQTIVVPWSRLIGLETKWALTLVTADRSYRAWAAPAPGRSVMRSEHNNTHRVKDAAIGGEIRPGDLPDTDSGAAAVMVRRHWRAQLESGALDGDTTSGEDVEIRVHWVALVTALVLMVIAIAGLA